MPASNNTNVGTSSRTPFKHEMLKVVLGKLTGMFRTPRVQQYCSPYFLVVDMCAGDGQDSEESGTS